MNKGEYEVCRIQSLSSILIDARSWQDRLGPQRQRSFRFSEISFIICYRCRQYLQVRRSFSKCDEEANLSVTNAPTCYEIYCLSDELFLHRDPTVVTKQASRFSFIWSCATRDPSRFINLHIFALGTANGRSFEQMVK